ncbi:MAG: hypothetical protein FJ357_03535 [Thaumarchaeota archaeon]|nr:hypothetical protein [Nitrososphaerota archaeon]
MKTKATYIAGIGGAIIILMAIFFAYSADQAKNRGKAFGDSLQTIQDELKETQTEFYSMKTMLDEGTIEKEEFLEFGEIHTKKMQEILKSYELLSPPESFVKSVKLFKTSTEKQLESDQYLIEWIVTNDTAHKIRSDLMLQESFENEMAGLVLFNEAKNNAGQN